MQRALVIDEWTLVREGVAAVLAAAGIATSAAVGTAMDGLLELFDLELDLVVVGACADSATLDVVRRVAANAHVRVVALVGTVNQRTLVDLCSAGAHAVVPRGSAGDDLRHSIDHVRRGERYLAPTLLSTLFSEPTGSIESTGRFGLTLREHEVLTELATGRSNHEIASTLHIGAETVKTHLGNIYTKLAVRRREQAISVALRDGLFSPI